mmetsp:Transcript_33321/g.56145  ORF Transcript_33321/g.56145 Transcript_33321/m.56145 type:complete len:147 (-) Transcript_33321:52-492(-)
MFFPLYFLTSLGSKGEFFIGCHSFATSGHSLSNLSCVMYLRDGLAAGKRTIVRRDDATTSRYARRLPKLDVSLGWKRIEMGNAKKARRRERHGVRKDVIDTEGKEKEEKTWFDEVAAAGNAKENIAFVRFVRLVIFLALSECSCNT